jgi:hypothetical protein
MSGRVTAGFEIENNMRGTDGGQEESRERKRGRAYQINLYQMYM